MNISLRRIAADIKICLNDNIQNSEQIYIKIDDNNPYICYVMIIGKPNTPYAYGYYFFDVMFPNNYPFVPPVVKLVTQGNNIRFNPNFYTNGKVCISILNTWSGPQWTSVMNLKSVLLSLLSLMNKNPLSNEPGMSRLTKEHEDYSIIIASENINTAIISMINNTPDNYQFFKKYMIEQFKINYVNIYKNINILSKKHNMKDLSSKIYCINVKYDYDKLLTQLSQLQSSYNFVDIKQTTTNKLNKQNIKNIPTIKAKEYYNNNNTNNIYIHNNIQYIAKPDKKGVIRWHKN